ncbi:hypothetical protein EE612_037871 [Oryza sativa]|nr:hypothetical protein EE612_037871 [Oryza sativa]
MASNKVVISALLVVVVSVLAATTTMADHHQEQVVYTPGQLCQPGIGYPTYPLPRCRAFVKRQCVAPGTVDEQVRRGCCRQLAAIDSSWCRCDALNHMLRIIYRRAAPPTLGTPWPRCSAAAGEGTSSARRRASRRSATWTSPMA